MTNRKSETEIEYRTRLRKSQDRNRAIAEIVCPIVVTVLVTLLVCYIKNL